MIILDWPATGPGEVLDYTIDFTGLLAPGESVVSAAVTYVGLKKPDDKPDPNMTGNKLLLWLTADSGPNKYAHVLATATLNSGRKPIVKGMLPVQYP